MAKKPPGYYPTVEELIVWTVQAVVVIVAVLVFASIIASPFL